MTRRPARMTPAPPRCRTAPPLAPMSEREFVTTTADPPWQYDNRASRGAAEDHYPVMSIEELEGLMDRLRGDGS